MSTERLPFPQVIDSTILAAIKSCETKAVYAYVEHWKQKEESIHLVAGGAFARGLEVARKAFWDEGYAALDAYALGIKALIEAYGDFEPTERDTKTLDRMCGAFEFYFDKCPLRLDANEESDGRPIKMANGSHMIEFSFAVPLPINNPETGDPILYTGRTDMIAEFAGGNYIWDDKTTSSLGPQWANQWDLRSQFTGYCYAAQEYGITVHGVIASGTSILKTKYDHARAMTNRSPWEMLRWRDNTVRILERFIRSWEKNSFELNLDDACSAFGGCGFKMVCKSPTPREWLPVYHERRIWDPLARTETKLDT